MNRTVGVIATLDTKGDEAEFLRARIEERGCNVIVIDPGVMGEPRFSADIGREIVAEAGGKSLRELSDSALRGAGRADATEIMMKGLASIVKDLYARGKLHGLVGIGGGTGTLLGTTAMKELPVGVPKLQVSTHPRAEHFGITDITIMQSVVDLIGLNSVVKRILTNAASAIASMVEVGGAVETESESTVGITCWGVVTEAAMNLVALLEKKGYAPILFHGATAPLEDMIQQRIIRSVIDLCAQELVALYIYPTLVSGGTPPSRERLESAGRMGLPLILTPGTLDGAFFPLTEPQFRGRKSSEHSPGKHLVRTSKEELERCGEVVAEKANMARGPVAIVIPLRGFSANDREGLMLYDPDADYAFVRGVERNVSKHVEVAKIDSHINDRSFAEAVASIIDDMFNSSENRWTRTITP
jgi:uncharacterized protein (UPF0261 family)